MKLESIEQSEVNVLLAITSAPNLSLQSYDLGTGGNNLDVF